MTIEANEVPSPARQQSILRVRTSVRRLSMLILIAAILLMATARITSQGTPSSPEFHTILEVVATLTVAFASALAFLRYYARKNSPLLFLVLATGLLGTCVLDGWNTVATSGVTGHVQDDQVEALFAWSWSASRLLFGTMMLMCWAAARFEARHGAPALPEWMVYAGAGTATLLMAIIVVAAPLTRDYFDEFWFPRPQDTLSGLLFLIVTIALWRSSTWQHVSIQFWILCAVLISCIGQLVVMPQSRQPYDSAFEWAHILKVCSYLAVLTGMLIDIYRSHRDLDRTAERLHINEERFALAAEGSSNGMWDWEVQSDRVWYAPRFWQLLGYADEPLPPNVVESFNEHLHPDDFDATWEAVKRHLEHGEELFDVEYRLRHLELGYRWFRGRGVALRDAEGVPIRMSGSIQDITESKLAEARLRESADALKRSNHELQQFASVASHDLQEPLRAVVGYCGLLQQYHQDKLDEDGKLYVQYAIDGATRMQQLIDSLLNLSRVQTHGEPFSETDLNDVVTTALDNLSFQIKDSSASVKADDLPTVVGDRTQLIQLFQNLISNGIKFHRSNEQPNVTVAAESDATEWRVSVRDNGIGIQPSQHERIFTVFQRLNSRDEYEGTGIGLAICKKVVERHGGRIWISSNDGDGSTFMFTISKELTENSDTAKKKD